MSKRVLVVFAFLVLAVVGAVLVSCTGSSDAPTGSVTVSGAKS